MLDACFIICILTVLTDHAHYKSVPHARYVSYSTRINKPRGGTTQNTASMQIRLIGWVKTRSILPPRGISTDNHSVSTF
ncbi:hypothetical protein BJ166DRAFT_50595 [Pestalotiopsis sp. NC0098]|nr:hypothetical protein BJ166DRAFT_50595 [Pestalotiopsis sp. NC0098]